MIRFALCDDDEAAIHRLRDMIMTMEAQYDESFAVSLFFSGEDFCACLNQAEEAFDIVLMDIEMGGITGIEAAAKLRENLANAQSLLLFISAHEGYYREIVNLHVFRYIEKRHFPEDFVLKLNEALRHVLRFRDRPVFPDYVLKKGKGTIAIPQDRIMYLESVRNRICLHTEEESHWFYGKLDAEEKKFSSPAFTRIHQSYLINFTYMKSLEAREILMPDDKALPISAHYREKVHGDYMYYRESIRSQG